MNTTKSKRRLVVPLILLVALICGFVTYDSSIIQPSSASTTNQASEFVQSPRANPDEPFDGKRLYREAFEALRDLHITLAEPKVREAWAQQWENKFANTGQLDTEEGADIAVRMMIESLGQRFDYYFGNAAVKQAQDRARSETSGIGVQLAIRDLIGIFNRLPKPVTRSQLDAASIIGPGHEFIITEVNHNSPASDVLKPGDEIKQIREEGQREAVNVEGMTLKAATALLAGKDGSTVELTIIRTEDGQPKQMTVQLTRRPIIINVVHTQVTDDGVTFIKLDHFMSQHGLEEMQRALNVAAKGKGIIFDLRGNPGGEVSQTIRMIQSILPEGTVVTLKNRHPAGGMGEVSYAVAPEFMTVLNDGQLSIGKRERLLIPENMPIVILVDSDSASASEMFAGSLQKNKRAIVIGTPTHGKGVGQSVINLSWGRRIHVTSLEFLPDGNAIDWVGVIPDLEVALPEDGSFDTQLEAALRQVRWMIGEEAKDAQRAAEVEQFHRQQFERQLQQRKQQQQPQPVR